MLVEPCGGSSCVSIINSTYIKENEPTKKYDFSQCGMGNNNSYSILNKALQLKVSTSVKNTLRPAEYPWLVSFIDHQILFSNLFFSSGSYRKSFKYCSPYSHTLWWYTHSSSMDYHRCSLYV